MKQVFLAAILALAPSFAVAQASPPPAVEMVLIPQPLAQAALNWIVSPNADSAVKVFLALGACLNDNLQGGVLRRIGPDQCEDVTRAIEARNKETADDKAKIADLQAQVAKLTPKPTLTTP